MVGKSNRPSLSFDLSGQPQRVRLANHRAPAPLCGPWTNTLALRFQSENWNWNLEAGLLTDVSLEAVAASKFGFNRRARATRNGDRH